VLAPLPPHRVPGDGSGPDAGYRADRGRGGLRHYRVIDRDGFGCVEGVGVQREKLENAHETELFRSRHLDFFLELAELAESELGGPKRMLWFHRLEMEYANLNAALESSLTVTDGIQKGLRLAGALNEFWSDRSHQVEGSRWLDKLLAASREYKIGSAVRAKALYAAGVLAMGRGEYTVAREQLIESATLFRQVGQQRDLAVSAG